MVSPRVAISADEFRPAVSRAAPFEIFQEAKSAQGKTVVLRIPAAPDRMARRKERVRNDNSIRSIL